MPGETEQQEQLQAIQEEVGNTARRIEEQLQRRLLDEGRREALKENLRTLLEIKNCFSNNIELCQSLRNVFASSWVRLNRNGIQWKNLSGYVVSYDPVNCLYLKLARLAISDFREEPGLPLQKNPYSVLMPSVSFKTVNLILLNVYDSENQPVELVKFVFYHCNRLNPLDGQWVYTMLYQYIINNFRYIDRLWPIICENPTLLGFVVYPPARVSTTPLILAARDGKLDIVQKLHSAGAIVDVVDSDGNTALHWAICNRHFSVVEFLLERGAQITALNHNRENALDMVLRLAPPPYEWIQRLLQHAREHNLTFSPTTYFHLFDQMSREQGRLDGLWPLIGEVWCQYVNARVADVPAPPPAVFTAFRLARPFLSSGDREKLSHPLLRLSEKPLETTPLIAFARRGNLQLVQKFLEAGAAIEARDGQGNTALYSALRNGHQRIAALLLSRGARINRPNRQGENGLDIAITYCTAYIPAILDHARTACSDALPQMLNQGLITAIKTENLGVVIRLLDAGADVNAADKQGYTALQAAVKTKHFPIIAQLLERGARVEPVNPQGKNVLDMAIENGSALECIQLLLECYAKNPNARFTSFTWGNLFTYLHKHPGHSDALWSIIGDDMRYRQEQWGAIGCGPLVFLGEKGIETGDFTLLSTLIEAGADVYAADNTGKSFVDWTMQYWPGNLALKTLLLNSEKVRYNDRLYIALTCDEQSFETIQSLLTQYVQIYRQRESNEILSGEVWGKLAAYVLEAPSRFKIIWPIICNSKRLKRRFIDLRYYFIQSGRQIYVPLLTSVVRDVTADTESEYLPIIQALVTAGAKIDEQEQDTGRDTALHWAIDRNLPNIAVWLMNQGASITLLNKRNENASDIALRRCQNLMIPLLIHASALPLEQQQLALPRIIPTPAEKYSSVCAYLLFERREWFDAVWPSILQNPANIQAVDRSGRTLLHNMVIRFGVGSRYFCNPSDTMTREEKYFEHLIQAGADINAPDNYGNTPLHMAVERKSYQLLRWLLDRGAMGSINAKNRQGESPLHMAAKLDEYPFSLVKDLIKAGADTNLQDKSGNTPLHTAALKGYNQLIRLLLDTGANPHARDEVNRTPMDLARRRWGIESGALKEFYNYIQHPSEFEVVLKHNVKTAIYLAVQRYLSLNPVKRIRLTTHGGIESIRICNELLRIVGNEGLHQNFFLKLEQIKRITAFRDQSLGTLILNEIKTVFRIHNIQLPEPADTAGCGFCFWQSQRQVRQSEYNAMLAALENKAGCQDALIRGSNL